MDGPIGCIAVREMLRPSLYIEEIPIKEGEGFELGRQCWYPVTFKARINPFDYDRTFSRLTLQSVNEGWRFYEAKVCLMPNSTTEEGNFIVFYERCERII